MRKWITDRLPKWQDADSEDNVWVTRYHLQGAIVQKEKYNDVEPGEPWMRIDPPEPYEPPKPEPDTSLAASIARHLNAEGDLVCTWIPDGHGGFYKGRTEGSGTAMRPVRKQRAEIVAIVRSVDHPLVGHNEYIQKPSREMIVAEVVDAGDLLVGSKARFREVLPGDPDIDDLMKECDELKRRIESYAAENARLRMKIGPDEMIEGDYVTQSQIKYLLECCFELLRATHVGDQYFVALLRDEQAEPIRQAVLHIEQAMREMDDEDIEPMNCCKERDELKARVEAAEEAAEMLESWKDKAREVDANHVIVAKVLLAEYADKLRGEK